MDRIMLLIRFICGRLEISTREGPNWKGNVTMDHIGKYPICKELY